MGLSATEWPIVVGLSGFCVAVGGKGVRLGIVAVGEGVGVSDGVDVGIAVVAFRVGVKLSVGVSGCAVLLGLGTTSRVTAATEIG
jgi:hypothetical protein